VADHAGIYWITNCHAIGGIIVMGFETAVTAFTVKRCVRPLCQCGSLWGVTGGAVLGALVYNCTGGLFDFGVCAVIGVGVGTVIAELFRYIVRSDYKKTDDNNDDKQGESDNVIICLHLRGFLLMHGSVCLSWWCARWGLLLW
jgi:hypothetical protein